MILGRTERPWDPRGFLDNFPPPVIFDEVQYAPDLLPYIKERIDAARSKRGRRMALKLADEIAAAANNEGEAVKKKMDVQKMAEANRAFAHYRW